MQGQHPETRERKGHVDDSDDSQDSSPTLIVEWSKLPDEESAKREELYQGWLESSLYTNYLNDILSNEKNQSERVEKLTQYIQELASSFQLEGQAIINRYQAEISKVVGICNCIPTSTGWDKIYDGFLWLISRTLGTPHALLLGCAVKQREFRLRSADRARLFSFLITKKHLLYCDVLAQVDIRKVAPLEVVPTKRNQHGEIVPSARIANQHNVNLELCHSLSVYETHREEDYASIDLAWRQLSCPARRFLKFFSALNVESIPEVLLLRLMTATQTWGPNGEINNIRTPPIDSIVEDFVNGIAFDFVQLYISLGLVQERQGDFGRRIFTVSPKVQATLVEAEPFIPDLEWLRLVLVCHAFPGRWEEQWFVDTGRVLFPQVRDCFQNCRALKEKCIENPRYGYKVLLTLILSSKMPGFDWKIEALHKASDILSARPKFSRSDTSYLNGLVKLRMAEVSRRLHDVCFSGLGGMERPVDPRSTSLEGAWRLFEAQERIMQTRADLQGAAIILKGFTSWDPAAPSTSERHILNQLKLYKGKIRRWSADFELASSTLSSLADDLGAYYDDTGCSFWNHYIGTLCELHKFKDAEYWARHAVEGYERLRQQGVCHKHQKRYRTLRLSLAEVLTCKCIADRAASGWAVDICAGLDEAGNIYNRLDYEYNALAKRDWATRFDHLRVYMGKALAEYLVGDRFEESQRLWEDLLAPARYCEYHDKITGFIQMIIDYSLCDIAAKVGDMNKAHRHLQIAKTRFSELGREHWWTCMGTTFLDLLAKSLEEVNLVSGITGSIA